MPYYIRLLTHNEGVVPVSNLREAIKTEGYDEARVEVEEGSADDWSTILVRNKDGGDVCQIERSARAKDELVEEEIEEFSKELNEGRPAQGAEWVQAYLKDVQTIYACQFLGAGFDHRKGSIAPHEVIWALKSLVGGIIQSAGEGFSNEDGYSVVLEIAKGARGPWNVALRDETGAWRAFQIELGNSRHTSEFLAGKIPAGAVALD